MKLKKQILALSILVLIVSFPAVLQAAKAEGSIKVADAGAALQAKFKMLTTGQGSANGFFQYSTANKKEQVRITVSYLKIDGKYAWFAGECTADGVGNIGNWFFGVVHDGGTPGRLVDQIWWEWIPDSNQAKAQAKRKVENLEIPSDNKKIQAGDIKVTS